MAFLPITRNHVHSILRTAIAFTTLSSSVAAAATSGPVRSHPTFVALSRPPTRASCGSSDPLSMHLQFTWLRPENSGRARKNDVLIMMAKKRRKKSSSSSYERLDSDDDTVMKASDIIDYETNAKNDRTNDTFDTPTRTLKGGPSLIFEMARRMLVWDDELYQGLNDASRGEGDEGTLLSTTLSTNSNASINTPRWRPSPILQQSVSNVNPAFRTSSPVMSNAGYAVILRRNSRKKMKPSMWRHCLRVYEKMAELEKSDVDSNAQGNGQGVKQNKKSAVRRKTVHHEAALVAAAKLGMWEEAIKIFRTVEESIAPQNRKVAKTVVGIGNGNVVVGGSRDASLTNTGESVSSNGVQANGTMKGTSAVTDNMVLSIINACVKGSKVKRTASMTYSPRMIKDTENDLASDPTDNSTNLSNVTNLSESNNSSFLSTPSRPIPRGPMRLLTIEERRRPLDAARDILLAMEKKHDIPLVARHVNPIASAYLRLGLRSDAVDLLNQLRDRVPPPPPSPSFENSGKEQRGNASDNGLEGIQLVDWSSDSAIDADVQLDIDEEEFKAGYEETQLNIHQVQSKDRGSYALLVQGAVMEEDWVGAVRELQQMTEAGLHPNSRNLNSWAQVMERSCRPSGNNPNAGIDDERYRRRSWKKKRDRIWLDNWK